jgi:hypothetical protein
MADGYVQQKKGGNAISFFCQVVWKKGRFKERADPKVIL